MGVQILADRMNEEMDKNESLRMFLLSIYNTFVKVGKPIARSILLTQGAAKKDLDRLVRAGFLRETKLRHSRTGALHTCLALPPDIIFVERRVMAVVEAEEDPETVVDGISEDTKALLDRGVGD